MNITITDIRRHILPRAAALLVIVLTFSGGCSKQELGTEQQLRVWIERGHKAVEAKDRRELLGMISPAYEDARGYSRDDIANMLSAYFLRQHKISLLTAITDIRDIGNSAVEIELTAGLAGTNDGTLGFSANAYRYEFKLQRDDDDWRLISAKWARLGDELH